MNMSFFIGSRLDAILNALVIVILVILGHIPFTPIFTFYNFGSIIIKITIFYFACNNEMSYF